MDLLIGRAARQGEPRSHETLLSLDDVHITRFVPWIRRRVASVLHEPDGTVHHRLGTWLSRRAQRTVENRHAATRRAVLRLGEHLADTPAFAGRPE